MTDMRKFWFFYYKDPKQPNVLYDEDIYAWTDDKRLAKQFQKERNMDLFTLVKEELNYTDQRIIGEEYTDCLLEPYEMAMYNKDKTKRFVVTFALTKEEVTTINVSSMSLLVKNVYGNCWQNPIIFNDKLYEALEVLEYTKIYYNIISKNMYPMENDDIHLKPDIFSIFIRNYGKTLKEYGEL